MATINISLPEKLKNEADKLVSAGYYVSFSDLVRNWLRKAVAESKYDSLLEEAKEDVRTGKAKIFTTKKQLRDYFKTI